MIGGIITENTIPDILWDVFQNGNGRSGCLGRERASGSVGTDDRHHVGVAIFQGVGDLIFFRK